MAFHMPGAASRRPLSPFHWCLLGKGGPYKLFIIKALFISLFKTRQNFSSITYSKGNHLREFLLKCMPDDCDESKGATRTPVSPRVPAVTEHPTPSSHRTPHSLQSPNTPLPSCHRTPPTTGDTILVCISAD